MRYVVQKDYIINNLDKMRTHCVGAEVIGVVKGNGYGLGLKQMSHLLAENGVKTLAVSRLDEAETLRADGIKTDILLLSPPFNSYSARRVCELGIIATVDSLQTAQLLNSAADECKATVRAHIMLDTGFGRFGFLPGEENDILSAVKTCMSIHFEGLYSHFYNAFSSDSSSVRLQASRYQLVADALEKSGVTGLKRHLCSSAGTIKYPEFHFDAVRLGSALLGRVAVNDTVGLQKVGFMECEIISVKLLPANHFVCYGEAYKTTRPTLTAVVPLGTCDGYGLSKTEVAFNGSDKINSILRKVKHFGDKQQLFCTLNGKKTPVIGRVGLTDLILDVTGIDCAPGDVAAFEFNPTLVDSAVNKEFV